MTDKIVLPVRTTDPANDDEDVMVRDATGRALEAEEIVSALNLSAMDRVRAEQAGEPITTMQAAEAMVRLTGIEAMVDRFLAWKLPDSVCSDQCATTRGYPYRTGTTLLTAGEAKQMLAHVLAGAARKMKSEIPGITKKHAIITYVCRDSRGTEGAWDEAVARLKAAYLDSVAKNKWARLNLVLTVERPDCTADSPDSPGS